MPSSAHGGDTLSFQECYGCAPVDFSANVNPFGVPTGVRAAIRRAAKTADVYPDPFCRELAAALAEHERVSPSQVLFGSGAADLIFRLALAARPRRALLLAPTFSEYEEALLAAGSEISFHTLRREEGFALTERILGDITPGLDLLLLCNPNNPTGLPADPALMRRILARCAECGVRPAVDECFVAFLDDFPRHTLRGALKEYPRLVLLDAFTKLYAMAGVRLGYALSDDDAFLSAMGRAGPPWSVSSLAQAAGKAALLETAYVARSVAALSREREILKRGLAGCGCEVFDSRANYVFFRAPRADFGQRLAERGFLLRGCANYRGLDEFYCRAAVRRTADNRRLLAAVRALG